MADRSMQQINIKCPTGIIELIDKDIQENQEFRNRSEYMLAALRYYIDHRTKTLAERKITNQTEEKDFIKNPAGGGGQQL
ncbi:MAG: ribbon-helix-helix domain-containing protein [Candidatus Methanoplasma sp.]|jgi:Arc/MetJ-type ribon-helix-helix transcriptional regulator|nr:ribbon-helix-helix domain-containing protein [Candidatus Methanoplasma sp.]